MKRGKILKKPKAQKKERKRGISKTHTNYLLYEKRTKGRRSRTSKMQPQREAKRRKARSLEKRKCRTTLAVKESEK